MDSIDKNSSNTSSTKSKPIWHRNHKGKWVCRAAAPRTLTQPKAPRCASAGTTAARMQYSQPQRADAPTYRRSGGIHSNPYSYSAQVKTSPMSPPATANHVRNSTTPTHRRIMRPTMGSGGRFGWGAMPSRKVNVRPSDAVHVSPKTTKPSMMRKPGSFRRRKSSKKKTPEEKAAASVKRTESEARRVRFATMRSFGPESVQFVPKPEHMEEEETEIEELSEVSENEEEEVVPPPPPPAPLEEWEEEKIMCSPDLSLKVREIETRRDSFCLLSPKKVTVRVDPPPLNLPKSSMSSMEKRDSQEGPATGTLTTPSSHANTISSRGSSPMMSARDHALAMQEEITTMREKTAEIRRRRSESFQSMAEASPEGLTLHGVGDLMSSLPAMGKGESRQTVGSF